ncbi:Carboxylic ester hydrolase [Aphelenchoides bicaudatus]|nr:Carboxylic ester hydrolase [Aphelenchoides bicaudatus]
MFPPTMRLTSIFLSGDVDVWRSHFNVFCKLTLLFAAVRARTIPQEDVVVRTGLGAIRGFEQQFEDTRLRVFLGVPYAKKPTGIRRFTKPEMIGRWEGELLATEAVKTCIYTIDTAFPLFPGAEMWNPPNEISEDCLGLNIWVPDDSDGNVLVWIFGGGFFSGSPSLDLYDGRVLAAKQKSIVVNINYRLGPFGFLYFGSDSRAPGNMGLLDQQIALQWIYENIAAFGGNPKKITLFGESAGGASCSAHLLAPASHQYFNKIIINSGAIINNWATKPKSVMLDMSLMLAKRLNCTHQDTVIDSEKVLDCMAKFPAFIIQQEADKVGDALSLPMTFPFVAIDDDVNFFQGNVFEKLRKREFKKDISVLLGTMQDEGTYWLPYYFFKYGFGFNHTMSSEDHHNKALISSKQYKEAFDALMPYFGNSQLVQHALMHLYENFSDQKTRSENLRDGVARFVGDFFFSCALIEFADVIADHTFGSTFMYYFTKRSTANPWPKWMGAMHGYEIEYIFGMPYRLPQLYNPDQLDVERAFSSKIMQFWGDFSRNKQPIDYWPRYNRIGRKSLVLSTELVSENSHQIRVDVHGKFCRLLDEAEQVSKIELRSKIGRLNSSEQPTASGLSKFESTTFVLLIGLTISCINFITKPLNLLNAH